MSNLVPFSLIFTDRLMEDVNNAHRSRTGTILDRWLLPVAFAMALLIVYAAH